MSRNTLPRSRELSGLAEKQMRTWALRMESQRKQAEEEASLQPQQLICPYLTISRDAGLDAREIADSVATKLGWHVFDRELLDYFVEHYHWSPLAIQDVDERTVSWFHETFGKWLDNQLVSQAEFVHRLSKVLLLAAQHESTIFIGRGAQFILPRDRGLAVRIIEPKAVRVERVMKQRKCGKREAERYVDDTDKNRADFVQRYFHHNPADARLYDFVINLERIPRESAIDLIAQQVDKFQERLSAEVPDRQSAIRQFRRLNTPHSTK